MSNTITPILNLFLNMFVSLFNFLDTLSFEMLSFEVTLGSMIIACLIIVVVISLFYKGGRTS